MTDITDIHKLAELETDIKNHTEQLNAELIKKRDIDIQALHIETNIQVIKNSLKQLFGERDSVKKSITIIPK